MKRRIILEEVSHDDVRKYDLIEEFIERDGNPVERTRHFNPILMEPDNNDRNKASKHRVFRIVEKEVGLKQRAEEACKWLQSLAEQNHDATLFAITNRTMPDKDGDKHGLIGIINASLGWGRWRVAATIQMDEQGNPYYIERINVIEIDDGRASGE